MTDWVEKVVGGAFAAMLGGIAWLVRSVFTNQKQISLLEANLQNQNKEIEKLADAIEKINDTQKMIGPVLVEQTHLLKEILHEKKL